MSIAVSAGAYNITFTTSKPRFSKGAGELQEASTSDATVQVQDRASVSPAPSFSAPSAPTSSVVRFSQLDRPTRLAYRDIVKDLAGGGRLYVRDQAGALHRADPMQVKERLDRGQPVEVISRIGSESRSSGTSSWSSASKERGLFTSGWNIADESTSRGTSESVSYSASPITEWDSLDFASEGVGVKGVATLPASGGSVVVSSSYEQNWSRRANEQWGLFTEKDTASASSGFEKSSYTAD